MYGCHLPQEAPCNVAPDKGSEKRVMLHSKNLAYPLYSVEVLFVLSVRGY